MFLRPAFQGLRMKRNKEGKEVRSTLTLLPSTLCSGTITLILQQRYPRTIRMSFITLAFTSCFDVPHLLASLLLVPIRERFRDVITSFHNAPRPDVPTGRGIE